MGSCKSCAYHLPPSRTDLTFFQANSEYIILLRELDKYETDVLFEHTRRRRQGLSAPLLIETGEIKTSEIEKARLEGESSQRSQNCPDRG